MIKNIDCFLKKEITALYKILVHEDCYSDELTDTYIIECSDNSYVQILIDGDVVIRKMESVTDYVVLGEYDVRRSNFELGSCNSILNNTVINTVETYVNGDSYLFGIRFLDVQKQYIAGFTLGFDEIKLIDEAEFETMLAAYTNTEAGVKKQLIN
ncbi:hypothetical protein V1389_06625 [Flavobacterium rakeshii]|uniref:hypothetical protein n=1 Tax=Flavobacterium rakeshii TaxID=1038845 RepID=UPI002E7C0453|nr:hypothetical protein [Flavobacterium rakeshii]MEE1898000.1 hypothetical protein [Flavobacterium rakeshii]